MARWMTVKQVARHMHASGRLPRRPSPAVVRRWINRETNPLPATKFRGKGLRGRGGTWLIKESDLDA